MVHEMDQTFGVVSFVSRAAHWGSFSWYFCPFHLPAHIVLCHFHYRGASQLLSDSLTTSSSS